MPTGYTSKIKDDITFEQYAMGCARAFDALIDMRDEASDALIPEELTPSNYHEQKTGKYNIVHTPPVYFLHLAVLFVSYGFDIQTL